MDEPEVERTKCEICVSGCKQVTTFTLSHIGLLTLVVCYCLVGAAMFEALEADHEKLVKQNMTKIRRAVAHDLWNMTQHMNIIRPTNWSASAADRLKLFEKELVKAMRSQGWDGNEDMSKLNWSKLGALFYSIIVITTIGYGHIAPKTMWGRIVTIFYAIIGIPLMVVCWSHIGDFMANSFRVIYWKACCYLCTRNPIPTERVGSSIRSNRPRSIRSRGPGSIRMKSRSIRRSARTSQRSADSAFSADSIHSVASDPGMSHPMGMGSMRSTTHQRSTLALHRNHPHFSTLPRTTQPRSTAPPSRYRLAKSEEPEYYVPSSPALKNLPILFNRYAEEIPSYSPPTMGLETTMEFDGDEDEQEMMSRPRVSRNRARSAQPPEHSHSPRYIPAPEELEYWDEEEEDEDMEFEEVEEERYERRPVPIWLCAFLVISYIVGGAFLFSNWEGWGILDSAYFCFITLTTIGFGDFVPAMNLTTNPEVSIALCSLYLLFGIALLAMSFNLVQEQVINAFKDLAMRLGIISEEDVER